MSIKLARAVLFLLVVATTRTAFAQTNSQVNSGILFDFPLPGARSLGMGGAFVAVADDPTASTANPAGLATLSRPQVSIEGRFWRFSNLAVVRGHAFGAPTGVGADSVAGLVDGEFIDKNAGVSFLSFVLPMGKFAVGGYRHEQARYKANFESEGPFLTVPGSEDRVEPFRGRLDLNVVNYGGAVAYRFDNGVSVGGGLALSTFSLDSNTTAYADPPPLYLVSPAQRSQYTGLGQGYGPPNFADSNRLLIVDEGGDDTGVSTTAGILIRPTGSMWSAGASIRLGPKFSYPAKAVFGPAALPVEDIGRVIDEEIVPFKVPDTYSVGVSLRPKDPLLLSLQFDRVQFSQLSEDIQEVFGIDTTNPPAAKAITEGLRFPDSNQIKAGAEYAFVRGGGRTILLRMGSAYETDHRMRYENPNPPCGSADNPCFQRLEVLFRPGDNVWHVMPGFGLVFPRIQIDGAFDISSRTQSAALSAVYRF